MPPIKITLSPIDRGWSMGNVLELEIDTTERLDNLFKLISKIKKIPKNRFVLKYPPSNILKWDKGSIGNKAPWSIRRCGIYGGLSIIIEPSFPLAWLWEPMQYYEDCYMDECVEAIKGHPEKKLLLQEIALTTTKPPPLFMTLRSFLRKYPEIFQMEINPNNNSGAGLVTVRLNQPQDRNSIPEAPHISPSSPSRPSSRPSSTPAPSSRPSSRSGVGSRPASSASRRGEHTIEKHDDNDDVNKMIVPPPPIYRHNLTGTVHVVGVMSPTVV